MSETKMSCKRSLPGNDQGRYGEIGVFFSSHRVGCEKVHAVSVGHGVFIHSSWYQARMKYSVSGMTKRAFSELCKWSTWRFRQWRSRRELLNLLYLFVGLFLNWFSPRISSTMRNFAASSKEPPFPSLERVMIPRLSFGKRITWIL